MVTIGVHVALAIGLMLVVALALWVRTLIVASGRLVPALRPRVVGTARIATGASWLATAQLLSTPSRAPPQPLRQIDYSPGQDPAGV